MLCTCRLDFLCKQMAALIYSFYSGTITLCVNMVLINFNLLTVVKLEMEVVTDFFPFSSPCSHLDHLI